jgi:ferric-dicitrate binding protein FerR (iron transport regulator)
VAAFTVLVTLVAAMALFTIYTLGDKQDMAYNTISVPNGQRSEITLSDGTRILINAGSSLRFPEQFQRKDREVFLDGEAYFEVSEKKSRPFCVHTEDITIRVTGTVFNVEAYAGDGYVVTTLVSGKVQLWNNYAKRGQKETVNLKPMQQAVFLKNNNAKINQAVVKHFQNTLTPGKIISSQLMDIDPFVSWTEGKLSFENETFGNLARKLERRYGVNIEILDESLKQIRFTGVLKNISVEQAMKALQLTARFHIDMRDNVIIIHPYGSNKTKIQ